MSFAQLLIAIYILSTIGIYVVVWVLNHVFRFLHDRVEWLPGSPAPADRWTKVWLAWSLVLATVLAVALAVSGPDEFFFGGLAFLLIGLYLGCSKNAAERQARKYHWMRRAHCGKCGKLAEPPQCPHCGWTFALPPRTAR